MKIVIHTGGYIMKIDSDEQYFIGLTICHHDEDVDDVENIILSMAEARTLRAALSNVIEVADDEYGRKE